MKYYGNSSEKVERLLNSDRTTGLSDKEAKKRLLRYGKNEIFMLEKKHPGKVALKLLYDPMSILLLLVALISFAAFPLSYTILVMSVWAINLLITVVSYYKAENIFHSLKSYGIPKMKVLRNGKVYMIDSRLIVPGDILLIEAGDIICADCKILSSRDLVVYEKDVCGTEMPVDKFASDDADATHLSDMHGMLFASSSVISGDAEAIVVATSYNTEIVASAGMIPVSEKQYPELFSEVKNKCRKWSMLIIFVAFIIFILKLFLSQGDIFNTFVLIISLVAASMTEALLPLTAVAAARGMSNSAMSGNGNRVIIKNPGSLEALNKISVFVATDEITSFENMMLLNKLQEKGIGVLLCASEKNAFPLATKYGAPVFRDISDVNLGSFSLGVFISNVPDDAISLLKDLKNRGNTVGALTTKLNYIRLLNEADVAFTYGKFKYKTGEYSKIYIENISGSQNQILSRVSDVICEENMLSTYRAVACAKGIYTAVSNAATYLVTMQSARVLLALISLFAGFSSITFTQILFGGMILDLLALFSFAFLSDKAYVKEKRKGIIDFVITLSDALILSVTVIICSSLPSLFSQYGFTADATSVSCLIMLFFPVIYLFFNTKKRAKNGSAVIIGALFLLICSLITLCWVFSAVAEVLSLKIGIYSLLFALIGVGTSWGLLCLRRELINNKR